MHIKNPVETGFENSGSPGRIRTCDTLINSQLRYHCATGEYVFTLPSRKKVLYAHVALDATQNLKKFWRVKKTQVKSR